MRSARLFPGATGTDESRTPESEDLDRALGEAEAVDRPRSLGDEVDDEVDRFGVADRHDAEQLLDGDEAQPSDLHEAADLLGSLAHEVLVAHAVDLDDVVGDEAMAAVDQLERALALARTRVTQDQHADREDVEQVAVQDLAGRQEELEGGGQPLASPSRWLPRSAPAARRARRTV